MGQKEKLLLTELMSQHDSQLLTRKNSKGEQEEVGSVSTVLQRAFEKEPKKLRDTMLQIANSLDLYTLQFASSIDCFETIINPYVEEQFNDCFVANLYTEQIKELNWPKGHVS